MSITFERHERLIYQLNIFIGNRKSIVTGRYSQKDVSPGFPAGRSVRLALIGSSVRRPVQTYGWRRCRTPHGATAVVRCENF